MKSQSGVYWNNAEARKNTLNRTAKSDGMKFIIYTNKFAIYTNNYQGCFKPKDSGL